MKDKSNLAPEDLERAEEALFEAVACLKTVGECQDFFRDLCTPAELQALVDRWTVVGLLREGLTYREINARTGVSVTTIGRVARFLTEGFGGYRTVIERLEN